MKNKHQAGYTLIEIMAVFQILLFLAMGISWIVNLFQLLSCDFAAPWRNEIIHAIGLIPPAALVTVWM